MATTRMGVDQLEDREAVTVSLSLEEAFALMNQLDGFRAGQWDSPDLPDYKPWMRRDQKLLHWLAWDLYTQLTGLEV